MCPRDKSPGAWLILWSGNDLTLVHRFWVELYSVLHYLETHCIRFIHWCECLFQVMESAQRPVSVFLVSCWLFVVLSVGIFSFAAELLGKVSELRGILISVTEKFQALQRAFYVHSLPLVSLHERWFLYRLAWSVLRSILNGSGISALLVCPVLWLVING